MKNNMTISGFIASNTSLNLDNLDTGVRVAPEIASRIRATGARTSGVSASVRVCRLSVCRTPVRRQPLRLLWQSHLIALLGANDQVHRLRISRRQVERPSRRYLTSELSGRYRIVMQSTFISLGRYRTNS